jgi:hypothetical protein
MDSISERPEMAWETADFGAGYDREPFGFAHNLAELDLFQPDRLEALAERYAQSDQDYFVARSAPSPGTEFYAVPTVFRPPHLVLAELDAVPSRILLKRPEKFDPAFRVLLDGLFAQVMRSRPDLGEEPVLRLESAIFISSAAATTPFHFDPEIAFFCQIEGEKTYHVFPPDTVSEIELERFYKRAIVNIGQIDLASRPAEREIVFALRAGRGLHQPQNAPHWVETGASRSISYSFVFETAASRSKGRARSFNHYLRKLGFDPSPPGRYPAADAVKAEAMRLVIPARKSVARSMRDLTRRA